MLGLFAEKNTEVCVSSKERGKWIRAVSRRQDGEGKKLNWWVSKIGGISWDSLERMME